MEGQKSTTTFWRVYAVQHSISLLQWYWTTGNTEHKRGLLRFSHCPLLLDLSFVFQGIQYATLHMKASRGTIEDRPTPPATSLGAFHRIQFLPLTLEPKSEFPLMPPMHEAQNGFRLIPHIREHLNRCSRKIPASFTLTFQCQSFYPGKKILLSPKT